MQLQQVWKGPLTVFCSFLLCLVSSNQLSGIEIMWGFVTSYIYSYHYKFNPGITPSDIDLGLPLLFTGSILGTIVGPLVAKKIGLKPMLLLSLAFEIAGLMSIHLTFNSYVSVCVYGLLVGYGGTSMLIMSIPPAWSYYPEKKGLMTGITFMGYTGGAGLWGAIIQLLVNPDNIAPIKYDTGDNVFPQLVIDNFTNCLYILSICIIVIGVPSVFGLSIKPAAKTEEEEGGVMTSCDILKNGDFWKLFCIFLLLPIYQQYIAQSFKQIGLQYINDDQLLSITGSLGFSAAAIGRFVWPTLLDKLNYKLVLTIIIAMMITFGVILPFTFKSPGAYMTFIILDFFAGSGFYPSGLVQCGLLFGSSAEIAFGYLHIALAGGTYALTGIKYAVPSIGYWAVTYIITGCVILAFLTQLIVVKGVKKVDALEEPLIQFQVYQFEFLCIIWNS